MSQMFRYGCRRCPQWPRYDVVLSLLMLSAIKYPGNLGRPNVVSGGSNRHRGKPRQTFRDEKDAKSSPLLGGHLADAISRLSLAVLAGTEKWA